MADRCRTCGRDCTCAPREPSWVDRAAARWVIDTVDWDRMHHLLLYALTHGGNMPAGAIREADRG